MSIKFFLLGFWVWLSEGMSLVNHRLLLLFFFLVTPGCIILPFRDVSKEIVCADKWSYFLLSSAEIIRHSISFFLLHQALSMPLLLFLSYIVNCCMHIGVWNHESVLSSKKHGTISFRVLKLIYQSWMRTDEICHPIVVIHFR